VLFCFFHKAIKGTKMARRCRQMHGEVERLELWPRSHMCGFDVMCSHLIGRTSHANAAPSRCQTDGKPARAAAREQLHAGRSRWAVRPSSGAAAGRRSDVVARMSRSLQAIPQAGYGWLSIHHRPHATTSRSQRRRPPSDTASALQTPRPPSCMSLLYVSVPPRPSRLPRRA
jgi:hypothetical protein